MNLKIKPHIHLSSEQVPPQVITCGDPNRARLFADLLDNPQVLAQNREYHSYLGSKNGRPILIISHGVGSAGAAICFQELIDLGVQVIVRIGTAGGLWDKAAIGDIVIPSAAIRQDGVSSLMVPLEYPAIPDLELTHDLVSHFKQKALNPLTGIILTSDLFYPGLLENKLAFYQNTHCLAVEMECSALFIISTLRKIRSAAVLCLDGNPLKWEQNHYNPRSDILKESLMKAAEQVIAVLSRSP